MKQSDGRRGHDRPEKCQLSRYTGRTDELFIDQCQGSRFDTRLSPVFLLLTLQAGIAYS